MEVVYLRKWLGCWGEITRCADCANKRGIYKWEWFICESGWGVEEKLRCALVAQIRGGFINGSGLFAKVVGVLGRNYAMR